jgi:hypothetical protein
LKKIILPWIGENRWQAYQKQKLPWSFNFEYFFKISLIHVPVSAAFPPLLFWASRDTSRAARQAPNRILVLTHAQWVKCCYWSVQNSSKLSLAGVRQSACFWQVQNKIPEASACEKGLTACHWTMEISHTLSLDGAISRKPTNLLLSQLWVMINFPLWLDGGESVYQALIGRGHHLCTSFSHYNNQVVPNPHAIDSRSVETLYTSKVDVAEKTEVGSGFAGCFSHVVMVGFGSH